mgnify:CR=1 FL=1
MLDKERRKKKGVGLWLLFLREIFFEVIERTQKGKDFVVGGGYFF